MKSSKIKKYINELSIKDLIKQIIFYLFFCISIILFDQVFICRLITWFLDFILISSTLFLIFSPKSIVEEVKKKYKKHNPLRNGINELINLLFVSFLTFTGSWITLILFIINITLITIIFSCKELDNKKESK